jgi:hypothetical protein
LDPTDYQALIDRSTVIERDGFGEKVLQTPEGLMVKIFRRKRFLTSALLLPYASRFVRNTRRLASLGIATVTVVDYAHCPSLKRHVVTYRPLPGITVRNDLKNKLSDPALLLAAVAGFMAVLHQKGVYFRSLHFGNIIVAPGHLELGLIDVADMTIWHKPLGARLRARNFRHMLRCREDAGSMQVFGGARFVGIYLEAAQLTSRSQLLFLEMLGKSPASSVSAVAMVRGAGAERNPHHGD